MGMDKEKAEETSVIGDKRGEEEGIVRTRQMKNTVRVEMAVELNGGKTEWLKHSVHKNMIRAEFEKTKLITVLKDRQRCGRCDNLLFDIEKNYITSAPTRRTLCSRCEDELKDNEQRQECPECHLKPFSGEGLSDWRFDGEMWQHYHGQYIGHVRCEYVSGEGKS